MTIPLPPFSDTIRLDPVARAALQADKQRIAIVGTGGWIGRSLAAGVFDALGDEEARERLVCFGSSERSIEIGAGRSIVQQPLDCIANLPAQPTVVFHLAFLTKDKIAGMTEADYVRANRSLSDTVLQHLGPIGADRIFVASSGAAAFADKADAAPDLRLYGRLKLDDESAFRAWARAEAGRRLVTTRIYSLAGPFINKHQTYALASFILDALRDRPIEVKAQGRVVRSYVAVRELLSLAISLLLADDGECITQFDSGGEPIELGDVALLVARSLGGRVERAILSDSSENLYYGDSEAYEQLLARYGVSSIPLDQQIVETASFLASCEGSPQCSQARGWDRARLRLTSPASNSTPNANSR